MMMQTKAESKAQQPSRAAANQSRQEKGSGLTAFEDNRPAIVLQRKPDGSAASGSGVVQRNGPAPVSEDVLLEKAKFRINFINFCNEFGIDADPAMADQILDALLQGLGAGEGSMAATPKVTDPGRADSGRSIIGSETEKEGKTAAEDVGAVAKNTGRDVFTDDMRPKRQAMFAKAQESLDVFAAYAGANFSSAIFNKVEEAGGAKIPLCFWSGDGAMQTAKDLNPNGLVLESTIGSWFDDINLATLTGSKVYRIDLWGTLSEIYAKKAAEYHSHLEFKGYVGPRANMQQNIFNMIESPTVNQIGNSKFNRKFDIQWYVVDCVKDEKGWWQRSGTTTKVNSREEAMEILQKRYM